MPSRSPATGQSTRAKRSGEPSRQAQTEMACYVRAALEMIARRIVPNGTVRDVCVLQGGISASMTLLEITSPDGQTRRVVLRIPSESVLKECPSAAADEFRTIRALFQAGVRVPEPLLLDESRTDLPTPYMLLAYVEGAPLYDPRDRCAYEHRRAEELARIHALDISRSGLASLRRRPHAFASRFRGRPSDISGSLDQERIHGALQPFWDSPPHNTPVLLHGDLWPGNLVWNDGELTAVVDWEDAEFGDPLADLAICRLDSLLILGREPMEAFTERYLSATGINTAHLPCWDLCAALRAAPAIATWAAHFPALGRPDITEESMDAALQEFVENALARLPKGT